MLNTSDTRLHPFITYKRSTTLQTTKSPLESSSKLLLARTKGA
ncbi:hypothetical protein HanPSC8_Chr17g0757881 [Helianthus annuus]|nr:hypothetical protein HanPSC8_Chr17g0757881 [Helianthus annuus]